MGQIHDGIGLLYPGSAWPSGSSGTCGDCGKSAAFINSSPTRSGGAAARLQLNPDTSTDHQRAEMTVEATSSHGSDGQDTYDGCSVYCPSSNRGNWAPNSWDWNNYWQAIDLSFSPLLTMGVDTGD